MPHFSLKNKRVTILGAARSGLAAARLLRSKDVHVFISEIQEAVGKKTEVEALKKIGAEFEFGSHSEKIYTADLIITSPGISSNSEVIQKANIKGIPVWSELELAARFCQGPIIAIAGSNGKSTTTALIGEMFKQAGRKYVVAGNIGFPLSDAVQTMDLESTAIVEASSFQLELIDLFKPQIALLLNVTPDHLDRHENFDEYLKTKLRIFQNQTRGDYAIFNAEDKATDRAVRSLNLQSNSVPFHKSKNLDCGCFVEHGLIKFQFEQKRFEVLAANAVALLGTHNLSNALAAISAAIFAEIPLGEITGALKNFKGLEHRLEFVREVNRVKYVNDSKATNLESMQRGLDSFDKPLIVIAGGREKGDDFKRISQTVSKKVKRIILLGESADSMAQALQNGVPLTRAGSLEEAVQIAHTSTQPGDVVLLCPGCSSFDMFENFEDRGRQFKKLVKKL